ncbi:hypothetical protein FNH22_27880 [Fulvivirga sp. M361]|uniref:hypothetical protein n=1 Tax=Fulvivirga sp. M361 TaxID=2594266 RepID=UPI00117A69C4|nr:hypothetical protein [Fulvivirga sp. M361]TRX49056.1 hypothetical protein FNH22_27880 [Fulvivirga sp. M361]
MRRNSFKARITFVAILALFSFNTLAQRLTYSNDVNIVTEAITYDTTISVASSESQNYGLTFSPDGSKVFHIGRQKDEIIQQSLNAPFDLSNGITLDGITDTLATSGDNFRGFRFSNDGTKIFIIHNTSDFPGNGGYVLQYDLNTPYSPVDGMELIDSLNIALTSVVSIFSDIEISPDRELLYILDQIQDEVQVHTLNTPSSIIDGSTLVSQFDCGAGKSDMKFSPDGTSVFFLGSVDNTIEQHHLATPFDLRGATTFVGTHTFP